MDDQLVQIEINQKSIELHKLIQSLTVGYEVKEVMDAFSLCLATIDRVYGKANVGYMMAVTAAIASSDAPIKRIEANDIHKEKMT